MSGPVALHHLVEGPASAPVLVLLDSLGSSIEMWDPQVAALAAHLRVIRFDLRGHGRSPAPAGPYSIADLGGDLIALLDRLGVQRASLCGLSIGGMIGMWVAAHAPERVDRLIVCCASAKLGPPGYWLARAATVRAEGFRTIAGLVVARWFTPGYAAGNPAMVERMRAMIASTSVDGYAACCEAIEGMDLEDDIREISAPTLVIAGAEDLAIPPSHSYRIASRITGSRVALIADAAHLANVEQPAAMTGHILDHLRIPVEEIRA